MLSKPICWPRGVIGGIASIPNWLLVWPLNPEQRVLGGVSRVGAEAQGIPIGLVLDGANRDDVKLAESTLASQPLTVQAARQAWAAAGAE